MQVEWQKENGQSKVITFPIGNGKDCMKSCSKFDSRGVKWDVPYLEIGVKSCDENEGGNIGSKQRIHI